MATKLKHFINRLIISHLPVLVALLIAGTVLFKVAGAFGGGNQGEPGASPQLFATQFGSNGQATSWHAGGDIAQMILLLGLGVPLAVSLSIWMLRFLPPTFLNVPNAEYWRAPRQYRRAHAFLFNGSLWWGVAHIGWSALIAMQILEANRRTPPALSDSMAWITLLPIIPVAIWVGVTLLFFNQKAARATANAQAAP